MADKKKARVVLRRDWTTSRQLALAAIIYFVLALVLLHPMIFHLGDSSFHLSRPTFGSDEDTLLNSTIVYHKARDLLSLRFSNYYNLPIFYPYQDTILFSELCLTQTLAALPLTLAGLSPHLVHDILVWLSFPLSALSMFILCNHLVRRLEAAIVGGLCYAFCPYQFNHLVHLNLRFVMFFPLVIYFLFRYMDKRRKWDLLGLTICFILHAWSNGYYFLFSTVFLAILAGVLLWRHRHSITRAQVLQSGASLLIISLAIIPIMWPYNDFNEIHDLSQSHGLTISARPLDFLSTFPSNWIWGELLGAGLHERTLFFGLVPMLLCVWALFGARREVSDLIWLCRLSALCVVLAAIF
ncbi:hypothetical protein ACFLU6_13460, partial [Acidobacteriota bacterium]